MSDGWISIHRKLREHSRYQDSEWVHLWVELLLRATHTSVKKVFDYKEITLKPGELLCSRKSLSKATGIKEHKIETRLKQMENAQQIRQQGGVTNRLISILKWGDHQGKLQPNAPRLLHDTSTDTPRDSTNNKGNKGNKDNKSTIVDDMRMRLLKIFTLLPRASRSSKEDAAWNKIKDDITPEEVKLLEDFYKEKKDIANCNQLWKRVTGIITLCNNYTEQIDLATAYFQKKNSGGDGRDAHGIQEF